MPEIATALSQLYDSGDWGRYSGATLPRLEATLSARWLGQPVLTCASGTLAVRIALQAARIEAGDEVILAAYDYEPNFLAIHAFGAVPVLVDIDPLNGNLDVEQLAAALSSKTKAILVSHLHGGLVPMPQVRALADEHGLILIEDAAQAIGATIAGRPVGTWGDIGTFSFGGSKLLSAGRGGALTFRRAEFYQRAKLALSLGVQSWAVLSELQAAVLLPQCEQLDARTQQRARAVQMLTTHLAHLPGLQPFRNRDHLGEPAYYKVGFWFDSLRMGLSRALFVRALRAEGVAFDEGFRALHIGRSPRRFRTVSPLAQAARAHTSIVQLHHPILLAPPTEVQLVASAVEKTYRNAELLTAKAADCRD